MIFVLLGIAYLSFISLSSLLITFNNSFFEDMIFFNEEINSDNFFISTSISFIPSAVNLCYLNSYIAST